MVISKNKFPHQHEFNRLGRHRTEAKNKYVEKFGDELWEEYEGLLDFQRDREISLGGTEKIHKSYEKEE